MDDICAVHERSYVLGLEKLAKRGKNDVVDGAPTYITGTSFDDALQVVMHAVSADLKNCYLRGGHKDALICPSFVTLHLCVSSPCKTKIILLPRSSLTGFAESSTLCTE